MQTNLKSKPAWIQILLFLGITAGVFLICGMLGTFVIASITGINVMEMDRLLDGDGAGRAELNFFRGMSFLQLLLFTIPAVVYAMCADSRPGQYLGLKAPSNVLYWVMGVMLLFVSMPLVDYTGALNRNFDFSPSIASWVEGMEKKAIRQIQFMLAEQTVSNLLLNLLFIAVFAGVGEEFFFRGILQRLFIRWFKSPWAGIIITAVLFSALHMQFFGFIPRLLLGCLLGAIYWYSGSLWTAVLAHFLYDAALITLAFFRPEYIQNVDKPLFDPAALISWALVSTALVGLILWWMKKKSVASYESVYADETSNRPHEFPY